MVDAQLQMTKKQTLVHQMLHFSCMFFKKKEKKHGRNMEGTINPGKAQA
jgi:hypothetical protein